MIDTVNELHSDVSIIHGMICMKKTIANKKISLRNPYIFVGVCLIFLFCAHASAQTTEIGLTKIDASGEIIEQLIYDYLWLEENLSIYGDDTTMRYLQGPVFAENEEERWDPEELSNIKEHGIFMGTNLADIINLIGMEETDVLRVIAEDGFYKEFPYNAVYNPDPRQGAMVLCWWELSDGYVPSFSDGMTLAFFAEEANEEGISVFGVHDMRELWDEVYWHFFSSGSEQYPTTTGFSIKWVHELQVIEQSET